ncbi:tRNA synthetases class I (E and Q), catalytic domain protein [Candidatus Endolissoclinum faulkneri L2]|uniref:tRNA synthetases class I (E and Q), catalytic domain protein n=1 Tax=Candidatus Endolissoclinum faulkneri L2 TaxID=1193729 RepID=K7YNX4_9PROT|nr:glutamate--tRNA ligase [Candidatus Endolissoclinum faulkneri]AFX98309.1 tRNA synthetases class I (E and Q), catalytic domain protein [Candidatus Endolissoclinum faulkneri L2]
MAVFVRFAPSPTGLLHVGNTRQALINWLFARAHGGDFMLRSDDTDAKRSTIEFAEKIKRDLNWLGLTWDVFSRQSDRLNRYAAEAERLKQMGWLYPCYESAEELILKRRKQLSAGKPPIYDRSALSLSYDEKAAKKAKGILPYWRFKLNHETVTWNDIILGRSERDMALQSDPIMIRADGSPAYFMASVVDDIDFSILYIIRGEDHVTNSATQIQIFRALGAQPPMLGHTSLIVAADGSSLSKRLGSISLEELRETHKLEAMAINSLLSGLGTNKIVPATAMQQIVENFDITRYSRANPHFLLDNLIQINAKILQETSYIDVADRLLNLEVSGGEKFWKAVRGNITRLYEVKEWWIVLNTPITPMIAEEDTEFCTTAADLLPFEELNKNTWDMWITAIKLKTARNGKSLFMTLRKALTAKDSGPQLKDILPMMSRQKIIARLRGEIA